METSTPLVSAPLNSPLLTINAYMERWEASTPAYSQMLWLLARHDYVQALMISLWNDATVEAQQAALRFAEANTPPRLKGSVVE